ncbi:MAG: DUF4082 domain-containing protein, partial [Chloroflexota bacterium]|nr:DUF4082 domain-containing protein [Chloroflexota bacterium]
MLLLVALTLVSLALLSPAPAPAATAGAAGTPQSLFTTQAPSDPDTSDGGLKYELGMKFQSGRSGQITALRYWKAAGDPGPHVGRLWAAEGGPALATVTFANETASGWQQQDLEKPVPIQADTTYIVSVNANGHFARTVEGLTDAVVNGDLRSLADGANGLYGPPGKPPTNAYQNSNYFRDVVFVPDDSAPATAISLENRKPGTTGWRIARPATTEIAGYAAATSVNRGESLPIKVSLARPGPYTIGVYRLGHYGGAGGRLVVESGPLDGVSQPPCAVTDPATRLVECRWATSYTLAVGADWTSGLYVAKLTDGATNTQAGVWFVVRDDGSAAAFLFQSGVATFQAYNNYGGYSLHDFNSGDGSPESRAFKVSFDRPFAPATGAPGDVHALMSREWAMARWLESRGYDLTYATGLDVHANPRLLRGHRAFLSAGPDAYWSLEQRQGVEQARDAGVNLGFFSAGSAYWRARFEDSGAGTANRVMACYKNGQDPVAPTVRFRDPENGRPENALLGVMYVGGPGERDERPEAYDFVVANGSDVYYANT